MILGVDLEERRLEVGIGRASGSTSRRRTFGTMSGGWWLGS